LAIETVEHRKFRRDIRTGGVPLRVDLTTIESVGMLEPAVIVAEALKILRKKCEKVSGLASRTTRRPWTNTREGGVG
jgi:hypothetical protein